MGYGIPLGRVARARRSAGGSRIKVTWRPRSSTTPRRLWRGSAGCSGTIPRLSSSTRSPRAPRTRGERNTSTPTACCTPDTQANHVRALAFGLVDRTSSRTDRGPARRADPTGRDPPRHRLPRHAIPAPRARRHRTSRRRLRAAPAGHSAVVVGDGRRAAPPRCGRTGTASARTERRRRRSTTTARAR